MTTFNRRPNPKTFSGRALVNRCYSLTQSKCLKHNLQINSQSITSIVGLALTLFLTQLNTSKYIIVYPVSILHLDINTFIHQIFNAFECPFNLWMYFILYARNWSPDSLGRYSPTFSKGSEDSLNILEGK